MTETEILQILLVATGGLLAVVTLLWRLERQMRKTDAASYEARKKAADDEWLDRVAEGFQRGFKFANDRQKEGRARRMLTVVPVDEPTAEIFRLPTNHHLN